jgi:cell division protein FtsW
MEPIRQTPLNYDIKLLFPALFLLGIGIVMVYSASSALALKKFGNGYYFIQKQVFFAIAGIAAMVFARYFPIRYYKTLVYPFLVIAIVLLVAIEFSGLGISSNGSARWIGVAGFTFQPSEFARFALVMYLAYSISKKEEAVKYFSIGFLPHFMVLITFSILLIRQPDFGAVFILGAITWIMLFVGGVRISYLLSPLPFLFSILSYIMVKKPYIIDRFLGFLNPWKHATDEGYQLVHSFMAFGTGGIWGTGIGKSYQKLFYLPEPHTDFIFSIIGEELGLLGVLFIIALYTLILWRGFVIAKHATDAFSSFLAMGLTTALGLQVCVNLAVTLGLLPTKGLTLPLLSYGGTSLLLSMASIGILMNIGASASK